MARSVDAMKRQLSDVGEELTRVTGRADVLYARRLELFKQLAADGVSTADLAELARCKEGAVRVALYKDRNGSRAAAPG